jgi:pyruvate dehydrogenase E1 component alpha subunit
MASTRAGAPAPLISNDQLRRLYRTLLRTRMLRERERRSAAAAPVAAEAIVTGTVSCLQAGDAVMPAPGDRLAALARGHRLERILSRTPAGTPLAGMLPCAASASAQFAVAAGHALAQAGTDSITLAFSGPGVRSLEGIRPALRYAREHCPGMVFVLETVPSLDPGVDCCGLCTIPVDGDDVIALFRVAQESIARARRGVGPTVIDCRRWPQRRSTEPRDAVLRMEQALARRGIDPAPLRRRTVENFRRELDRARRGGGRLPAR